MKLEKGEIVRKELSEHVGKEKNKLSPTDIGMLVTDYLDQQFTDVMDYNFTAMVEKEFDEIAEGDKSWVDMIRKFYEKFHSTVDRALESQPVRSSQPHLLGTRSEERQAGLRQNRTFRPVAQIGDADDAEKPRFASLRKGQLIASITLEEALDLFTLPRTVGRVRGERGGDRHRPASGLRCGTTASSSRWARQTILIRSNWIVPYR